MGALGENAGGQIREILLVANQFSDLLAVLVGAAGVLVARRESRRWFDRKKKADGADAAFRAIPLVKELSTLRTSVYTETINLWGCDRWEGSKQLDPPRWMSPEYPGIEETQQHLEALHKASAHVEPILYTAQALLGGRLWVEITKYLNRLAKFKQLVSYPLQLIGKFHRLDFNDDRRDELATEINKRLHDLRHYEYGMIDSSHAVEMALLAACRAEPKWRRFWWQWWRIKHPYFFD